MADDDDRTAVDCPDDAPQDWIYRDKHALTLGGFGEGNDDDKTDALLAARRDGDTIVESVRGCGETVLRSFSEPEGDATGLVF